VYSKDWANRRVNRGGSIRYVCALSPRLYFYSFSTVNNVESDKGNGLGFSLSKSLRIRSIILGSFSYFVVSLPIPRSDFVLHNERSICVGRTNNEYNSKRT